MFDTIAGLPVHPLVVHAVVVLAPLAALLLLAYAFVPRWRAGLRWPTLGLSAIAAASAFVATQSGEKLEHRIGDPAYDHAEKGDLAAISCYVLFVVALLVILWLARPGAASGALPILGMVAALVAAGFLMFAVVNAGHSGASSAWKDVVSSSSGGGGSSD